MLKPSRSGPNMPSGPSRPNDSANQKKYTSHSASPNAKRMLSPAREKRLRRIVASSNKIKAPSPSRPVALASRDLICACRRESSGVALDRGLQRRFARRSAAARDFAEIAMTKRRQSASHEDAQAAAEHLAIAALGFIAGEPERLGRFLAMSGIGPDSIRAAAREPQFLLGVLDHLAADEPLLLAFAAGNAIRPRAVIQARETMPGTRCRGALEGPPPLARVAGGLRATAQRARRLCRASAAIAAATCRSEPGAAPPAARRGCCAIPSSRRWRSRTSIATPFMPPSRSATIRRSPTSR